MVKVERGSGNGGGFLLRHHTELDTFYEGFGANEDCSHQLGLGVCLKLSLQVQQLVVKNRTETQPCIAPTEPQRLLQSVKNFPDSTPTPS